MGMSREQPVSTTASRAKLIRVVVAFAVTSLAFAGCGESAETAPSSPQELNADSGPSIVQTPGFADSDAAAEFLSNIGLGCPNMKKIATNRPNTFEEYVCGDRYRVSWYKFKDAARANAENAEYDSADPWSTRRIVLFKNILLWPSDSSALTQIKQRLAGRAFKIYKPRAPKPAPSYTPSPRPTSNTPTPVPTPSTETTCDIEYLVWGSGAAQATYRTENGTRQQTGLVGSNSITVFCGSSSSDFYPYISIQNLEPAGGVGCEIRVHGRVVAQNTSMGGYVFVSCEG